MQWYYWPVLGILVLVTAFVWYKALKSSKARRARVEREEALFKRDKELRRDFATLTEEIFQNTDDERLLSGVAMNIQIPLEPQTDMTPAFLLLPPEKQYVYTLEYFGEDTKKGLSEFFKANGRPLITLAPEALRAIGLFSTAALSEQMLPMCDDEDETVSVDPALKESLNIAFNEEFDRAAFVAAAAKYIRDNKEIFLRQEI